MHNCRKHRCNGRNSISLCRSSQLTVSASNKYESREKINTAAQRTLIIDSGSDSDSNAYESYAGVRTESEGVESRRRERGKRATEEKYAATQERLSKQMRIRKRWGRGWRDVPEEDVENLGTARKMDRQSNETFCYSPRWNIDQYGAISIQKAYWSRRNYHFVL